MVCAAVAAAVADLHSLLLRADTSYNVDRGVSVFEDTQLTTWLKRSSGSLTISKGHRTTSSGAKRHTPAALVLWTTAAVCQKG
jgi:capsule polysaccharide modification protein KpsS